MNHASYSAPDIISWHELYPALVSYFRDQFNAGNSKCYLEINEFIKRNISNESNGLLLPLFKAFYYALLTSDEFSCLSMDNQEISKEAQSYAERLIVRCRDLHQELQEGNILDQGLNAGQVEYEVKNIIGKVKVRAQQYNLNRFHQPQNDRDKNNQQHSNANTIRIQNRSGT